jgi:DNA-binding CsgD family transcriptional regulator
MELPNFRESWSVGSQMQLVLEGVSETRLWGEINNFLQKTISATSILYGFTHSAFSVKRIGLTKSAFIIHNHPQTALDALGKGSYLDHSTYASAIMEADEFFFWHKAFEIPNLSEARLRQLEINKQNNMDVGITVKLPFADGLGIGGIGICCHGLDPSSIEQKWGQNCDMVLQHIRDFDKVMRPLMVASRLKLTGREREVLAYSAGGMLAKEIASHLGIQTKTVYNTLERARESLKSATTMEAVAKAYIYGLI